MSSSVTYLCFFFAAARYCRRPFLLSLCGDTKCSCDLSTKIQGAAVVVIDLGTASHWTPLNPKEDLKLGAKIQSVHNQWTSCTLLNKIQAVGELLQSFDSQNIGTHLVVVVFRSGRGFHHRPMACPLPYLSCFFKCSILPCLLVQHAGCAPGVLSSPHCQPKAAWNEEMTVVERQNLGAWPR